MEAQGPFGFAVDSREQIEIGDIVQLANSSGDFYHTLIISEITDSDILVCAQSDNALDRPLSSYRYAGLRILHISGVAIDIPYEDIFAALYNSVSIQSIEARTLNVEDLQ